MNFSREIPVRCGRFQIRISVCVSEASSEIPEIFRRKHGYGFLRSALALRGSPLRFVSSSCSLGKQRTGILQIFYSNRFICNTIEFFIIYNNHTFFARAKKVAKKARPMKSHIPHSLPIFSGIAELTELRSAQTGCNSLRGSSLCFVSLSEKSSRMRVFSTGI